MGKPRCSGIRIKDLRDSLEAENGSMHWSNGKAQRRTYYTDSFAALMILFPCYRMDIVPGFDHFEIASSP